jgi:hypothetical protein
MYRPFYAPLANRRCLEIKNFRIPNSIGPAPAAMSNAQYDKLFEAARKVFTRIVGIVDNVVASWIERDGHGQQHCDRRSRSFDACSH